jgi:hypothetical protein
MTRTNIVDDKKLDCIVTSRQVIVYNIKNFAKVKPIKFCVTNKIKLFQDGNDEY